MSASLGEVTDSPQPQHSSQSNHQPTMTAQTSAKPEAPAEKTPHDSKHEGDSDPASASDFDELSPGAINERALLRKLDWRLLPAVGILYLLSFLDRSNVGNARIEGLATDLHMTGNQYLTGLTLYFVGYVIFEVRSLTFWWLGFGNLVGRDYSQLPDPLQYHPQTNNPSILASHLDGPLGYCRNTNGRYPKPGGVLCGTLLPRRNRVRSLPRSCVLLLHVVQEARETVSYFPVL